MKNSFTKYYPFNDIIDDFLIRKDGAISAGIKLLLPPIFTLPKEEQEQINLNLDVIIKRLMPGTTLQKIDFFFEEKYESKLNFDDTIIQQEINKKYYGKTMMGHYSSIYLVFNENYKAQRSATSTSLVGSSSFAKKILEKDRTQFIQKAKEQVETFITAINGIKGFKAKRMDKNDLGIEQFLYFNQRYQDLEAKIGAINPYSAKNNKLVIGDEYVQTYSLKREGDILPVTQNYSMPSNDDFPGIDYEKDVNLNRNYIFPLTFGLPFDHIMVTSIQVLESDDIVTKLEKDKIAYNITAGFGHRESIAKQEQISQYLKEITEFGYKACNTSVNVIVKDKDYEKIKYKTKYVETAFSQMNGATGFVENEDNANIFFSIAPGVGDTTYRNFLSLTEAACCYINKETNYYSDPQGLLYSDRLGRLLKVETWNSIIARNGIVIAPTGAGKSVFLNGFITKNLSLPYNVDFTIIDIGYSYERTVKFENGLHFDGRKKDLFKFNIFLCPKDKQGNYIYKVTDESGEGENDKITFVETVISVIWKGNVNLTKNEEVILQDMINEFYQYVNKKKLFPDLNLFYDFIDIYDKQIIKEQRRKYIDFESLKMTLEPYVKEGDYAYLLNSKENINLVDYNFTVFDLEEIAKQKKVFPIICIIIIELTLEKIKNKTGRKYLVIDEALDFLIDPKMGEFIGYMYRTVRKKDGAIILATQNLEFFQQLEPRLASSIIANSHFKVFLDHSEYRSAYKTMKDIGIANDFDIELLESLVDGTKEKKPYKEFLMMLNNKRYVLRNTLTPFEDGVYTTRKDEVEKINKYFEKTGNQYRAVKMFVKEKYENYE
jgi:type IV secretory pathway VirB4 component